jgi:hypothetical protein
VRILSIDTTKADRGSHAVESQHISRRSVIHSMLIRVSHYGIEAIYHDFLQPLVNQFFVPEEALPVLHPLEVRYRHAARIRQNIRNYEDPLVGQNGIGDGSGGPVGAFAKNLTTQTIHVSGVNDRLGCGRQ